MNNSETPTQPDISDGGMSEPDYRTIAAMLAEEFTQPFTEKRLDFIERIEANLQSAFQQGREHERNLKGNK